MVDSDTRVSPIDASTGVIEVKPLAMVGPYSSLVESCKTAAPCGFTELDHDGNESKPPHQPDCSRVLDGSNPAGSIPGSLKITGEPRLMFKNSAREIRLAAVNCAVPQGLRAERFHEYVFVKRADGWWRTAAPLLKYEYNDKYCSGGLYVRWNDKPARTIMGLAASQVCLACTKSMNAESVIELMVRVETSGAKPAVFAPLPLGRRHTVSDLEGAVTGVNDPDPDCRGVATAESLTEQWVSDDEVILVGKGDGAPLDAPLTMLGNDQLAPGHYRFTR